MFSSMSVPPRSLTPQRSASVAASRPLFTPLAWRFARLQLAHDAHVLGELPGLLDVPEHDRDRRAQAGAMRRLDDLDPARDGQLVRADLPAHAVVQGLRRGA